MYFVLLFLITYHRRIKSTSGKKERKSRVSGLGIWRAGNGAGRGSEKRGRQKEVCVPHVVL